MRYLKRLVLASLITFIMMIPIIFLELDTIISAIGLILVLIWYIYLKDVEKKK